MSVDSDKPEITCAFCGKDLSEMKFREDYFLVPWADDPDEPESLNKLAKPAEPECYIRFCEMNNLRAVNHETRN